MPKFTAERFHDFSAGHRVFGHEGHCARLHGHNYRVHFIIGSNSEDQLDDVGRVLDFSIIKDRLCEWLETHWDHKFLIWSEDPWAVELAKLDSSVVWLPFNPTAENLAEWLLVVVGPAELVGTGCNLISVKIEETRKCSATILL